jgi:PAS domain S-box-containing protein
MGSSGRDEAGEGNGGSGMARDMTDRRRTEDGLPYSELKYRTLFELAGDAIVLAKVADGQVRVAECNDRALRVFGRTREQMLGATPVDLSPTRQPDGRLSIDAVKSISSSVLDGQPQFFEWRHCRFDGTLFDVEVSQRRLDLPDGPHLLAVIRDVTDRKQAEAELRMKSSALDSADYAVAFSDPRGVLSYVNQAFVDMWGYARVEDVLNRPALEFWQHADRANEALQAVTKGRQWLGELDALRRDGSVFPAQVAASMVSDAQGRPVGLMAYFIDVTEQRQAEEALRASEQRFRQIFASAPISILEQDFTAVGDWLEELRNRGVCELGAFLQAEPQALRHALSLVRLVDVNDTTLRLFEVDSKEKLLRAWPGLFTKETLDVFAEELQAIWEGRNRAGFECAARTFKGRSIQCQMHWVVPLDNGRMDLRRVIVAIDDITERKQIEQALQESQRKLQAIFDHTSHFIGLMESDGTLIHANRAALAFAGTAQSEVLGKPFWETPWWTHSQELQNRLREAIRRAASGEFVRLEADHPGPDGAVHYFDSSISPVVNENGAVVLLIPEGRDVTARKVAEKALRESQDRLRSFMESAPDGFLLCDRGLRIIDINARALADFGVGNRDELIGRDFAQVVRATAEPGRLDEYLEALERGETFAIEDSQPGGLFGDKLFRVRVFTAGDALGIISTDVTSRRRAEQALRESEERYRSFVQNFRGIAYRGRMDFVPVFVHGAVEELTGYTQKEICEGKPRWDQVIHPDDLPAVFTEDLERLRSVPGYSYEREYRIVRKDGTVRWIHDVIQNVCDASGKPTLVQGAIYDITERKDAEAAHQQLESKLRVAHKLQAVGQLAAGVAHDFNSLLTVVLGNAELLSRRLAHGGSDRNADESAASLERIVQAVERGQSLVQKMLMMGRARVRNLQLLDLSRVIAETHEVLKGVVGSSIRLHVRLEPNLRHFRGDVAQMEQVVLNLALNARDAMRSGGELLAETANVELDAETAAAHPSAEAGAYVMLMVQDTGEGIEHEHLERVFEPFFSTKPIDKGTGLGLSIVHSIVEQVGGHITVESSPGRGTTFRLYFPAVE